jgi:hypothetical protein
MRILLTLLSTLFFIGAVNAQKILLVTMKDDSTKTRRFQVGNKLEYKLSLAGEYKKGKVIAITENGSITLTDDENETVREVLVGDLYALKKATTLHSIGYVAGSVFLLSGAVLTFSSSSFAGEDGSTGPYIAGGIALMALGAIPYLLHPKEYIKDDNATFSVY